MRASSSLSPATINPQIGWLRKTGGLLKKLGKHTTGKGCLCIKKLKNADTPVLKEQVRESVQTTMKEV